MFYDAIVVLGLHMPQGQPSEELIARLDKAAACWIEGRAPAVIPCGGQREDELFPEADWMAQYLMHKGLPESVIFPDRESINTEQNIANAAEIIGGWGGKAALLVTSDYHLNRALAVCRDQGLTVKGIPVKTPGGPRRIVTGFRELLGTLEYRLGWQKKGRMNPIQRFFRKGTGS